MHGSLSNDMTIITKVGVSSVDHINDDMLEVNRVSHQAFSVFAYCKQSKTGGGEVLGKSLEYESA